MNKTLAILLSVFLAEVAWGLNSKDVLKKYMEIPTASESYQFAQIQKVGTHLDFRLYKFYNFEDPFLSSATPFLKQALENQMRLQLASDRMRSTLVTPTSNKQVYELVEETMVELGFSESQIKNAKIFVAFGEPNAYTYGIDKNNVVIVIFDKLLKLMSKSEAQAVIAHELGHIVGQHILAGVQMNYMFDRIARMALSHNPARGIDPLSLENQNMVDSLLEENYARLLTKHMHLSDEEAKKESRGAMNKLRLSVQIQNIENRVPVEVQLQSAQTYLLEIVKSLEFMEMPQTTKDFFSQLAYNLASAYRPNVEDLMNNLKILSKAIQRESEMTADLMAVSSISPFVSSRVDMKLAGGGGLPEKPKRQDVLAALELQQEQLDSTVATTTREELAKIIGQFGGDHPQTNIRAVNQVLLARHFEVLRMRNRFTRLIVLRDQLNSKHKYLASMVEQKRVRLAVLENANQGAPGNLAAQGFDKQIAALEKAAAEVEGVLKSLTADILTLIGELGFEKNNPRLNNFMEYRLNEREFKLVVIDQLQTMMANNPNDKEYVQQLTQQINRIKQELAEKDSLMQAIGELVGDKHQKTFGRLLTIDSQPDLKTIRETRAAIRAEEKSTDRKTRADMELSTTRLKTSAIITKAQHLADNGLGPANPAPAGSKLCGSTLQSLIKKAK